jgi:hypothetical protein
MYVFYYTTFVIIGFGPKDIVFPCLPCASPLS